MEEAKEITKYQWKKGEYFGKIVEIKSTDDKITYFKDGSQILNNVIEEFLEEMEGGEEPITGGLEIYMNMKGSTEEDLSNDNSNISTNENKVKEESPELTNNTVVTNSQRLHTSSPIDSLITKLSKKNVESVEARLNINLPKKNVFKMLLENGDDTKEDLIESIIENAVKQIEINKLQEFLITETSNFIKKYYER